MEFGDVISGELTFDQRQKILTKRVDQKRNSLVDAHFEYKGHKYQIDDGSLSVMNRMATGLIMKVPAPSGGYWRTADNDHVNMTDQELPVFLQAAGLYAQALRGHAFHLKDAIADAKTDAGLDAVNIETGWPTPAH